MTNTSPPLSLSRITEFDGLRGLLAWWVVVGHLAYFFDDALGKMLFNNSAVEVFIMLSGFVISYLLDARKESATVFITRRWFRLFPVYIIILLASAATLGIQSEALNNALFLDGNAHQAFRAKVMVYAHKDFWLQLGAHITMLHGMFPSTVLRQADSTFLSPGWSLSVEWQFYLIAPFVFFLIRRFDKYWTDLGMVLLFLVALKFVPGYKTTGGFLPSVVFLFVTGIGSYFVWKEQENTLVAKYLPWGLGAFLLHQLMTGGISGVIWGLVFAVITGTGPRHVLDFLRRVLNAPFVQVLGQQSYPVYLVHMPVAFGVAYAANALTRDPYLWGIVLVAGTFVATFVLSALLHKYVEVPGIGLGKRVAAGFQAKNL